MKKYSMLTCLAASLLAATNLVSAHHSFAQFNPDIQRVISGEVARWAFNNPHSWLYLNVENDDGTTTLWSFEGSGPVNLIRRNIDGNTFKPGDQLTFMYCPMRDGRPGGHLGWIKMADGSMVDPSDGGCAGDAETIERWRGWLDQGFTSNLEAEAAAQ